MEILFNFYYLLLIQELFANSAYIYEEECFSTMNNIMSCFCHVQLNWKKINLTLPSAISGAVARHTLMNFHEATRKETKKNTHDYNLIKHHKQHEVLNIENICTILIIAKEFGESVILLVEQYNFHITNEAVYKCKTEMDFHIFFFSNLDNEHLQKSLLELQSTNVKTFVSLLEIELFSKILPIIQMIELHNINYMWIFPKEQIFPELSILMPKFFLAFDYHEFIDFSIENLDVADCTRFLHDNNFTRLSKSSGEEKISIELFTLNEKNHWKRLATISLLPEYTWNKQNSFVDLKNHFFVDYFLRYPNIKVVTAHEPPFCSLLHNLTSEKCIMSGGIQCTRQEKNDSGIKSVFKYCCVGLNVDMILRMQEDLKANISLYLVENNIYGSLINDTWNGMVGDVVNGKADIIIAALSITKGRAEVLDFVDEPYIPDGISIATVLRKIDHVFLNFKPFFPLSNNLWIVVFVVTLLVSIGVWFTEKNRQMRNSVEPYTFNESILYFVGLLFQRDMGGENPLCVSSRVISVCTAMFLLIIMSTYTAVLTSNVVTHTLQIPLTGLSDDKMRNPTSNFKFGLMKNSARSAYFEKSKNPQYRRMSNFMKDYNHDTSLIGLESLKTGKLDAIISDKVILNYYAATDKDCSIHVIHTPITDPGYGIALAKRSKYKKVVSKLIAEYKSEGYFDELLTKWIPNLCETKKGSIFLEQVGTIYFGGLFFILCIAVAVSFAMFVIEWLYYWRSKQSSFYNISSK